MSIIDNAKDAVLLAQKYNDQELYERIVDLRDDVIEFKGENVELKEAVLKLEQLLAEKENLVWDEPYYWKIKDEEEDGPYCQHCQDAESKLIRLIRKVKGLWLCPACKNKYTDKDYSPAP